MVEPVRSVVRALSLIDSIARGIDRDSLEGLRLADIVRESGLQKTTVSRLLQTLVRTGHVEIVEGDRYILGSGFVFLGRSAERFHSLAGSVRHIVERVAEEVGDSVYISIRTGDKAVCIGLAHGAFPVRTLTLNVGDVRPLGVGAGSLALLAFLESDERRMRLARLEGELGRYPSFSLDLLVRLVDEAHVRGYAFNEHLLIPGVSGVGVPIVLDEHRVVGAISAAAIDDRLGPDRLEAVVAELSKGASQIAPIWAGFFGVRDSFPLEAALEIARLW